ncbi:MAG: hypothetical protein HZA53_17925 [Planctomycetes bacterium]|nr:hypothetical protein [Planctomycetota bacterium]
MPGPESHELLSVSLQDVRARRPARDWLEEYWGKDWPGVRAELERRHVDLNQLCSIPPWEQVESEFRDKFHMSDEESRGLVDAFEDWTASPTALWLLEKFKSGQALDDWSVAEIESIVIPMNAVLREKGQEYVRLLDQALQRAWGTASMIHAPISTHGAPDGRLQGCFYSMGKGFQGWAVKVGLRNDEFPELVERGREIRDLQAVRDRAVRDYLKTR